MAIRMKRESESRFRRRGFVPLTRVATTLARTPSWQSGRYAEFGWLGFWEMGLIGLNYDWGFIEAIMPILSVKMFKQSSRVQVRLG
ncbi:protein of unknown function [Denitratisoma oestradiolicum]|uniref:Uncharacterized protein n=1 Tax=Denitratisoma oestradiolicum TaxID=311182 RepID=A0A6S6XT00_9PROT|nr:protein of unknown function [Denitratisoma oestradiolicum]